jgi:hypothetical protein
MPEHSTIEFGPRHVTVWPRSPKAMIKAARWVDDLAGNNEGLRMSSCARYSMQRRDATPS